MSPKTNVLKVHPSAKLIPALQIETGKIKYHIRSWEPITFPKWKSQWDFESVTIGYGSTAKLAWSDAWKKIQKEMIKKLEQ